MMDYKQILMQKVQTLMELMTEYNSLLDADTLIHIKDLIDNTFQITNGMLDELDYDMRNQTLMNCHTQLDTTINNLTSKFKKHDKNPEIYK